MRAVRIELGLEGKAGAHSVAPTALRVGVVEPVSRVEVRAWRGYANLQRAAAFGVMRNKRPARWGARLPAANAEAVVIPTGAL